MNTTLTSMLLILTFMLIGAGAATVSAVPDWQIGAPGQTVAKLGAVDDVYTFSHAVSISPDGRQVAYVQQGAAYIYSQNKVTKIVSSDASALTWGPVGWRVRRKTGQ